MKKLTLAFFTILLLFFSISICLAQTTEEKENVDVDNQVYLVVNEMPYFPGGYKGMADSISAHIVYPKEIKKKIKGNVILSFIVGKQGNIEDITIVRGLGGPFDSEAIRVVSLLDGKWKPGKQNGKLKRVLFTIPIEFKP